MTEDKKLSKHFSLYDLAYTSAPNLLNSNIAEAAKHLPGLSSICNNVLEPIYTRFNRKIIIYQGFCTPEVAQYVGDYYDKSHQVGRAVHFCVKDIPGIQVYNWIIDESEIYFGTLTLEMRPFIEWLHISLMDPNSEKNGQANIREYKLERGPNGNRK